MQKLKRSDKWVTLCCTIGYKWVIVMDGVKSEFNGLKSMYTKNDSERKRFVGLRYCICNCIYCYYEYGS